MSSSAESIKPVPELVWPPQNTGDLYRYFDEMGKQYSEFAGSNEHALGLIRALGFIASVPASKIKKDGFTSIPLSHSPNGMGVSVSGEALICAAYSLTGALALPARSGESYERKIGHEIYVGSHSVRKPRLQVIPLVFKEVYQRDDTGRIIELDWSVRPNYPQQEDYERRKFADGSLTADEILEWENDLREGLEHWEGGID